MQPTKRLILCVEDDDDTCSMLSALLGRVGYEVRTASGVAEGLRSAEGGGFDLYILDNWFADGTGLDLCRRIREFDGATPILFFSGLAQESDRRSGLDAGAQGYLVKPNDLEKLVETVTQLIGNDDGEANSRPAATGSAHRHQQPGMPR
jgi:DNA-binding response OmpR family regulator